MLKSFLSHFQTPSETELALFEQAKVKRQQGKRGKRGKLDLVGANPGTAEVLQKAATLREY